jgi:hypothetical protein
MPRMLVFLLAFATLAALAGCGDPDGPIESMTVYSLNGEDRAPPDKPWKGEQFHGFGVLGKTAIASASDRGAILAAIKKGIAESDGRENKCFWPHHGVRLVQNGATIEYVICFHCLQLERYSKSGNVHQQTTTSSAGLLDSHLEKAGIPLQN